MMGMKRGMPGWGCLAGMLAVLYGLNPSGAKAQSTMSQATNIQTTEVQDTVHRADGSTATGSVLVSWPAFTTASGQTVARGSVAAKLSDSGVLDVLLAPNAGANPTGTYYTAVYHLNDGSVSRENWVVPVSSSPVLLQAVKASVLPASVAMQTVSKQYVDQQITQAALGKVPIDGTPFVAKAGDTLTGPLLLAGDPVSPDAATTKSYVDDNVSALQAGLTQKISTTPTSTQTVVQPSGTELEVNKWNGVLDVASFKSPGGTADGIANTLAQPECVNGCDAVIHRNYVGYDQVNSAIPQRSHVADHRGGMQWDYYLDPHNPRQAGVDAARWMTVVQTQKASDVKALNNSDTPASYGLLIEHKGVAGGNNVYPQNIVARPPYFKSTFSALSLTGNYYTVGQHVLDNQKIYCYAVGDCLSGARFLYSFGGYRDNADEGAHAYDFELREDSRVFQGVCASGCSTGATQLAVTATQGAATQGEGRYLIDLNPSKVMHDGVLTGGEPQATPQPKAVFTGTSFPVSVFFALQDAVVPQAKDMAPGAVQVQVQTSGAPTGFQSSTASLAASGVACVADTLTNGQGATNYEMAPYSVVDGTHLQMTFNKPHVAGAAVAVGGLCGYGLEQTVDTVAGIRQVFPVLGSYSATGLYYVGGTVPVVGVSDSTSGYRNVSLNIASLTRSNNVVTLTTASDMPKDLNGVSLTVAGVTDSSYNGSFVVTTTGSNTMTYTSQGADGTSSGGTVSLLTGGYNLYPMAEILGVMNPVSREVDGTMQLAPNTVAWESNDAVEVPHYYITKVGQDMTVVEQQMPRPALFLTRGIAYLDNVTTKLRGWQIQNLSPSTNYLGNGGLRTPPDYGLMVSGEWNTAMQVQAGDTAAFDVRCSSHGCSRWNSGYSLMSMESSAGTDALNFAPSTSQLTFNLRGTQFAFSPTGFTAATIQAGTSLKLPTGAQTSAALQFTGAGANSGLYYDTGLGAVGIVVGNTRVARFRGLTNAMSVTSIVPDTGSAVTISSFATNVEAVTFSATPTFNLTSGSSRLVLTGNVSNSTIANGTDGQRKCFNLVQDATGGHTFVWPTNVLGGMTVGTTAGKRNHQCFVYYAGDSAWLAESPGVTNQ